MTSLITIYTPTGTECYWIEGQTSEDGNWYCNDSTHITFREQDGTIRSYCGLPYSVVSPIPYGETQNEELPF